MIEGLQDILKADSSRATKMDCTASVEEYINKSDWRINANANTGYSSAGLVNNLAGKAIANYADDAARLATQSGDDVLLRQYTEGTWSRICDIRTYG